MKRFYWLGFIALAFTIPGCAGQLGGAEEEYVGLGDPEPAEDSPVPFTNYDLPLGAIVQVCHVNSGLNLRTGPSTGNKIIRVLDSGVQGKILDQSGSWYELEVDGESGWGHGNYLCLVSEPAPDAGGAAPDAGPPPPPIDAGASSGCFIMDNNWQIREESNETSCLSFIEGKEKQYKDYLETGDYHLLSKDNYSLLQRSAIVIFFGVNKERISKESNQRIEEYYVGLAKGSSARNTWGQVEAAISSLPDAEGVARDIPSNLYYMPTSTVQENERVLFDTPSERRTFGSQNVLSGTYSEEELYDRLRSLATLFYLPRNGAIVVVQDMVDGEAGNKFGVYYDSFFYIYRDGQKKKVVEVVGNLRHSSGNTGPYYTLTEFGVFKDFADVHVYNSDGTYVTALRGVKSWEVKSSGGVSSSGRKSYNMHPGGSKSSRGSAGCATIPNRASSGRSKDFKIFMTTIHTYAFHSDKLLKDSYSTSSSSVNEQIDLNSIFIKKIRVY